MPMSSVPVMLAGWLLGSRAGLLTGLLIFPLNTLLLNAAGQPGWDVLLQHSGGVVGSIVTVVIGFVIGRLHDLSEELIRELKKYQRADVALQASEGRFRLLTEASLAGVFIIQHDRFLYVNPALARMFDYEPDELLNRLKPLQIIHPKSRDLIQQIIHSQQTGQLEQLHHIVSATRKDGSIIYCEVFGRSVEYQGLSAIIGTVLDVTATRRVQEESVKAERLQAELAKEKEINELKSRFVSMISHEYRTPLAVITLYVDMFKRYRDRLTITQQEEYLTNIQAAVTRLTTLIEDTLTMGQSEIISLNMNPVALDIEQFCRDLVEEHRLTSAAGPIHLSRTGPDSQIVADPKLLHQIITNLLSNADKYSPEGSLIEITLICEGDNIIIQITDQGIGIPEEDQKRLFQTFHRASNVGTTPGTGLGLAIVRQAVEAHGGAVSFQSQIDVGTTFTITLPMTPPGYPVEVAQPTSTYTRA